MNLKSKGASDVAVLLGATTFAQDAPKSVTLFSNVRIFDGKSAALTAPMNVLVRGNKIEKMSAAPIATDKRGDTVIIDGAGKTLMPGRIFLLPSKCELRSINE